MPALRNLQLDFVEAVLSGKFEAIADHIHVPDSTPIRRLSVYRNNTISNLSGALREVYPIVEKLVGNPFFNQAAREFIASNPSTSGDLNDYGAGFAEFLADYALANGLSYLPDVARLEWALEKAYHAPDHAVLELQRLAEIPQSRYGDLRLKLHPAATLIASDYPLQTIWSFHQPGYEGEAFVDLDAGGVMLLITRRNLETVMEPLSRADHLFLTRLSEGEPFMAAVSAALEEDKAFPLQERLVMRVVQGDIVNFYLEEGAANSQSLEGA